MPEKTQRVMLAIGFLGCLLAAPSRASVVSFSKDNTTTVTSIKNWRNGARANQKVVLYSVGPFTVQANDIVSAHFQQQLSYRGGPANLNPMAASDIVVASSATAVDQTSPGFVGWVARPAGGNMSVNEELSVEVLQRTGSYKFTAAASNIYINAVAYAASPDPAPDFTVPEGTYGELVAVVERGVTWKTQTAYRLPRSGGAHVCPADAPTQHIQYSLGPVSIPAQTMVDVRYDVEGLTSVDHKQSQRLGRSVVQGTSASATSGTTLLRKIQTGITRGEHHWVASHAGGAFYGSAVPSAYFNAPIYSYSATAAPLQIVGPNPNLYGHFVIEMRPAASNPLSQDTTRNVTALGTEPQVVYSVGPIDVDANAVVEVRYMLGLDLPARSRGSTVLAKIVRAPTPTATTGTEVLRPLSQRIHPHYIYSTLIHSTAERPGSALTHQYYNVVAWVSTGSLPTVHDWGELEAVKR